MHAFEKSLKRIALVVIYGYHNEHDEYTDKVTNLHSSMTQTIMSTDFLDVPDAPGQSSSSSGSGLPPLKLRQNERDPPRIGAK